MEQLPFDVGLIPIRPAQSWSNAPLDSSLRPPSHEHVYIVDIPNNGFKINILPDGAILIGDKPVSVFWIKGPVSLSQWELQMYKKFVRRIVNEGSSCLIFAEIECLRTFSDVLVFGQDQVEHDFINSTIGTYSADDVVLNCGSVYYLRFFTKAKTATYALKSLLAASA